jgi:hypothetical protein
LFVLGRELGPPPSEQMGARLCLLNRSDLSSGASPEPQSTVCPAPDGSIRTNSDGVAERGNLNRSTVSDTHDTTSFEHCGCRNVCRGLRSLLATNLPSPSEARAHETTIDTRTDSEATRTREAEPDSGRSTSPTRPRARPRPRASREGTTAPPQRAAAARTRQRCGRRGHRGATARRRRAGSRRHDDPAGRRPLRSIQAPPYPGGPSESARPVR